MGDRWSSTVISKDRVPFVGLGVGWLSYGCHLCIIEEGGRVGECFKAIDLNFEKLKLIEQVLGLQIFV